jgi:hypothetical protein
MEAWNVRYMIAAAFDLASNANFRTHSQSPDRLVCVD